MPDKLPARAKWLSNLGERVVDYFAGQSGRWVDSIEIADAVGERPGHRFRAQLTALVERNILEARTGAGYRLIRGG